MTIVCDIWMISLELNWLYYDPSWMLQLCMGATFFMAWVVFNNFLLINATHKSMISSNQKRLFFAVSLYVLSFFAKTPFINTLFFTPGLLYEYYMSTLTLYCYMSIIWALCYTPVLLYKYYMSTLLYPCTVIWVLYEHSVIPLYCYMSTI